MHRPTDLVDLSIDLGSEVLLLTRRQRQVVVMLSLGMTQAEISNELGISQAAVSKLIACGLERLRVNAVYLHID